MSIAIPAVTNEDRIPHEKAVWRPYHGHGQRADGSGTLAISVDYGAGQIVQGFAHELNWEGVQCWRFGWAPQ